MNIDCTLSKLMVPGFAGISPPFGTKKAGDVTSLEASENSLLPFRIMRPRVVSENSTTTQIQANCVFEFTTGGISLTLGAAAYSGCRVSVVNSSTADATVKYGQTEIPVKAKDGVHLEYINGTWAVADDYSEGLGFISLAMDWAGLANREVQKTIKQRIQTGIALIKNRGVIFGCTVTKSTTAIRSLNLVTGAVFMNGIEMSSPAFTNAALVPSNNSGSSIVCYAYIYLDNGAIKFAVTAPSEPVPDNGLSLYRITIPAVNTESNDPNLDSVTLTDVRRMEAGYPLLFNSVAYASVSLPFTMIDSEYEVIIEILELKGGSNQRGMIYPGDKAANGFKIYSDSTLDMVKVRWTAIKTNL
jgi:hypothetical protein